MQVEHFGKVALIRINAGKANALSEKSLTGLGGCLDQVVASDARALVLTGYDKFFCAGLSLPSLLGLDRPAMSAFMGLFSDVMVRVFTWPRPVVAAINGYAVAGGCVLALQADVRLMRDDVGKIGLTEVGLGLGLPPVALEVLRCLVPTPSLLPVALEGRLLSPNEARELDVIHEVCPAEDLEARALRRAEHMAKLPAQAFAKIKNGLRQPVVEVIRQRERAEGEAWLDAWFSAETQAALPKAVTKLSS